MKLLVARGCVSGLRRYLPPQASSLLEATPAVFCGLATASGAARTVCAYLLGTLYLDPAAFLFGGGPWRAEWEESPQPTQGMGLLPHWTPEGAAAAHTGHVPCMGHVEGRTWHMAPHSDPHMAPHTPQAW